MHLQGAGHTTLLHNARTGFAPALKDTFSTGPRKYFHSGGSFAFHVFSPKNIFEILIKNIFTSNIVFAAR